MNDEWIEPEWEDTYVRMLDAVGEYLDSMGDRNITEVNERDIRIIRALIEFYDFEAEDIQDILKDVLDRTEQLEREEESKVNGHH
jgi:K+/H+ antiporter YhaU regulatory subunit KhtT